MQNSEHIILPSEINVDESEENAQKRWSSIAGKKRKERLALLHG